MRRTMPCEGPLEHSESRRTRQQQHERRMTRARYGRARYEIPFPPFSFESIVLYYHDEARHGTGDTRAGDCSLSRLVWVGLGWVGLGRAGKAGWPMPDTYISTNAHKRGH